MHSIYKQIDFAIVKLQENKAPKTSIYHFSDLPVNIFSHLI